LIVAVGRHAGMVGGCQSWEYSWKVFFWIVVVVAAIAMTDDGLVPDLRSVVRRSMSRILFCWNSEDA
jgi:hypothetical protein